MAADDPLRARRYCTLAVRATSGLLTATGTVVKSAARVGFTEGAVTDATGAVVATASSTLLVFDLFSESASFVR